VAERLAELRELQDAITASPPRRADRRRGRGAGGRPGEGRSHREAPEIDGVVQVPDHLAVGDEGGSWPAVVLWFLLCASDFVDGWLARRDGTTRAGAYLDPLADKVLVLGAMFMLVANGTFSWVPVALIATRELGISLYRTLAGTKGISVPARRLAKWKTVIQQFAVAFVLFPPTHELEWLWLTTLWVAVALTLLTGVRYVWYAGRISREQRLARGR
jgi:CDP-diacylglycerol---glycerol-3-phosphate 3-phosphatidyltransferase